MFVKLLFITRALASIAGLQHRDSITVPGRPFEVLFKPIFLVRLKKPLTT